MDVLSRARTLKLDEPPLAGRVRYFESADSSVVESIHCGILFIMSFWSGPSFQSLKRLKEVLSREDPNGLLEVCIVDINGCEQLVKQTERIGIIGGYGEAAWISAGKILCTANVGSHPLAIATFTRHLLEECGGTTLEENAEVAENAEN